METVLDEVCASCGNERLPDGQFCLFCGDVLPESSAKGAGPAQPSSAEDSLPNRVDLTNYAGFWLRVVAGAIDVIVEAAGALVLTLVFDLLLRRFGYLFGISPFVSKVATGMAFILFLSIGSWLYSAFTESSAWRATVGKRVMGLQVVTAAGEKISFGQATARHLMKFLSLFMLMIGFMMAGWTKRRQALHDLPSDCLVIRVPQDPRWPMLGK